MSARLALIWFGALILLAAASLLLPAFAYPHDQTVWTATLSDFVDQWWSAGPFGSVLLPAAALLFALLHIILGSLSSTSRYHFLLAVPLIFVTVGLIQLGGAGIEGEPRFTLLKIGIFGWLAGGVLAWGRVLSDKLPLRVHLVAAVVALLYLVSPWFSWPMLFLLTLVIVLYWGAECLLATSAGDQRGVLPLVLWIVAVLFLVLLLVLERFQPQLHRILFVFPQIIAALLLLTPSVATFANSNRREERLVRNLERERDVAQKRLEKEVRRLEAIKNESMRALEIELSQLRSLAASTPQPIVPIAEASEPSDVDAEKVFEAVEDMDEPYSEPSFEDSDLDEVNVASEQEQDQQDQDDDVPILSEPSIESHQGPETFDGLPSPEELSPILEELAVTINTMRRAMGQLQTTLADIIGHVALEEARVADPLETWDSSLMDTELNLFKLRDLFGLAQDSADTEADPVE